ncbi:MAG TPA: DUF3761 domain-containing protein [Gemmatimonadaceae bacterium]|jgi:hypothetical protein
MRFRILGSTIVTAFALVLFAAPSHAQTASAIVCADGTTSTATGTGACEGHGGLKAKATSTVHTHVTCKDGTMSNAGRGACANHGGVVEASSTTKTTTVTRKVVHADDKDSTGAIALCKNGLYSHATMRRGACTGHGGVARFLKP